MPLLKGLAIVLLVLAEAFWIVVLCIAVFGNGATLFDLKWWAVLLTVVSIFVFWYLVFALIRTLWRWARYPNGFPDGEDPNEPTDRNRFRDAGGPEPRPDPVAGRRSPRSGRPPVAGS